jgi:pimeloyl-ACP methyl ester carboxylesterase
MIVATRSKEIKRHPEFEGLPKPGGKWRVPPGTKAHELIVWKEKGRVFAHGYTMTDAHMDKDWRADSKRLVAYSQVDVLYLDQPVNLGLSHAYQNSDYSRANAQDQAKIEKFLNENAV